MNKEEIIEILKKYNLPKEQYVILSGASLVLKDVKESAIDIDIVVTEQLEKFLLGKYDAKIEWHDEKSNKDIYYINELNFSSNLQYILTNKEYEIIKGYPCQTLDSIIKLKQNLGREKDLKDIELINNFKKHQNLSVLSLAYLGDAVFELYIREYLLNKNIVKVKELQQQAINYVSAKNQVRLLEKINNNLTEEELEYVKKGRNAKSHKAPKNTDILTYKHATGFETLIGYLYLNNKQRLEEIMQIILED